MTDIKFSCPSCGQRIKCDQGHGGLRIPCPGCNAELEIPKVPAGVAEGAALPQAELVGKPARKTQAVPSSKSTPQHRTVVLKRKKPAPAPEGEVAEDTTSGSDTVAASVPSSTPKPARRAASGQSQESKEATPKPVGPVPEAIRCLCPCCRSELKVKVTPPSSVPTGTLPVAELVRPGSRGGAPAVPPPAEQAEPAVRRWSETVKAAARDGGEPSPMVRAQPGGSLKPRLSYIFSGKPPVPPPRPDGTPRRKAKAQTKSSAGATPDAKPTESSTPTSEPSQAT